MKQEKNNKNTLEHVVVTRRRRLRKEPMITNNKSFQYNISNNETRKMQ